MLVLFVGGGATVLSYMLYKWLTKKPPAFSWKPKLEGNPIKEILVVTTKEQCDDACQKLCQRDIQFGFDCEWVSYYGRSPVSLIQLATYDGFCVLFRLCKICQDTPDIPNSLKTLLYEYEKFGVGIVRDGMYLKKDYNANVKNCLDLRHLVEHIGHRNGGLGFLARQYLGIDMDKNKTVTVSNWEAEQLSKQQMLYAAMDAYVAIKIYKMLQFAFLPFKDDLPFDKDFMTQPQHCI